jgi:hypothetical protein
VVHTCGGRLKTQLIKCITDLIIVLKKRSLIYILGTFYFIPSLAVNNFEDFIPPTENFLIHFATLREKNLKNLVAYIKMECGEKIVSPTPEGLSKISFRRKLQLCYFPSMLSKYLHLQARIFLNKDELIYFPDIENTKTDTSSTKSPWNLSQILSQNYILRSNPNGVETTIDQIVELLVQKKEILKELDIVDQEIKKMSFDKTLMSYYLIPSLKATINNISPLGAMLELFYNINCNLDDKFCLYLQGRIGSVLNEISQNKHIQIKGFINRFNKFTSTEKTQKSERLKSLLEFNTYYRDFKITNREQFSNLLKNYIMNFVADGEGGFLNDRFQSFAQHILLLSEISFFAQHMINLSPYANDLSAEKKYKAIIALEPKINESLLILETQFKLLGFDEEIGE